MQIKEIKTREEVVKTLAVLTQIYDNLNHQTYADNTLRMMENGYRMAAVFEDENNLPNHKCIGVCGFRIIDKILHGRVLEIEDFMIDRQRRGIGVGKILIRFIEWQATTSGCHNIIGSLETKRLESQKIFTREKFLLDGFSFKKTC